MKTFHLGGIHPHDHKLTAGKAFQEVPIPQQLVIPLSQHIGAPAVPCVTVGDKVLAGQCIAQANGMVSANVHTPVAGTVLKIDRFTDTNGRAGQAIYIESDVDASPACDTLLGDCALPAQEILEKIKAAGIVGLGGACFPTHVKLTPPPSCQPDTLLINAVECEPYLTHNHQLMMENGKEIIIGIQLLMRVLKVEQAIIGIENNKKDAIRLMQELCKNTSDNIRVEALCMKYPQGGEKQLIDACLKRQVKSGQIPASVGAVVQNVATVFAVYEAVIKGKALTQITMTVSGSGVARPGNYKVAIGTPLSDVVAMAGGVPENCGKIIIGGPMMGRAAINLDAPVSKRSSGIVFLSANETQRKAPEPCIRCGKCIEACPMGLEPYLLSRLSMLHNYDQSEQHAIADCLECGCCSYTCPSQRPLLDYIRMGKAEVMKRIKMRQNK